MAVAERAEADLRELLAVPADYRVLFMQGGATAHFSAVPLNLARRTRPPTTSTPATGPSARFARLAVSCPSRSRLTSPPPNTRPCPAAASLADLSPAAAYLHYTPNETIDGVEFPYIPDTGPVPLVADMSSSILSRPLDVSRFGIVYAGAQKNIGPSGITVVIVRDDILGVRARIRRPSSTTALWRKPVRCSIRRRLSAGTWRASCFSG